MTVFEIHVDCVSEEKYQLLIARGTCLHLFTSENEQAKIWMTCGFTNFWNYATFITANPGILTPVYFAGVTCHAFVSD